MSATAHQRGHLIVYVDGQWVYADDLTPITAERPCSRCGKPPTSEGYDACLGHVEGVRSACCGHGAEEPYSVAIEREEES